MALTTPIRQQTPVLCYGWGVRGNLRSPIHADRRSRMARSNPWVAEPPRRSTRNPAPSSLSEVIAQLQADWHALQIVDRAEAIDELLKAKLSRRHIADVLNCSESLVRNYLSVLQASPNDIDLARNGEIGLREIVRRAKSGVQQTESCIEQGYSGAVADPQQGAAVIL